MTRPSRRLPLTPALIRAAAADAGNRSMRAAGRTRWNADDFAAAAREFARLTDGEADPPKGGDTGRYASGYRVYRSGVIREDFGSDR